MPWQEEGLALDRAHVWRVMGFSVVRVPFEPGAPLRLHTTDAYILLVPCARVQAPATAPAAAPAAGEDRGAADDAGGVSRGGDGGGGCSWRAHYWLGAACTADKSGAAAALVVQLDGLLSSDGATVSHRREVEGAESSDLLSAFPSLQAAPGGSTAGWRVATNAPPEPRLFRVRPGRGCLGQVTLVRPTTTSLTDDAVYVLDAPLADGSEAGESEGQMAVAERCARLEGSRRESTVYQWHGHEAPLAAKAAALLLAFCLRSIDHRGCCDVHVLGSTEAPADVDKVLAAQAQARGSVPPSPRPSLTTMPPSPSAAAMADGRACATPDAEVTGEAASMGEGPSGTSGGTSQDTRPGRGGRPVRRLSADPNMEPNMAFWSLLRGNEAGRPLPPPLAATPLMAYRLQLLPLRAGEGGDRLGQETAPERDPGGGGGALSSALGKLSNLFHGGGRGASGSGGVGFVGAAAPPDAFAPRDASPVIRRRAISLGDAISTGAAGSRASDGAGLATPPRRAGTPEPPFSADGTPSEAPTPRLRIERTRVEASGLRSEQMLRSTDTLVLDCGGEVYVWSGAEAGGYMRWAARTLADLLRTHGHRRHDAVVVMREQQGCESAGFRSKFARWHWLREANPEGEEVVRPIRPAPVLSVQAEVDRMRRQREALVARQRRRDESDGVAAAAACPPSPGQMGPAEAWESPRASAVYSEAPMSAALLPSAASGAPASCSGLGSDVFDGELAPLLGAEMAEDAPAAGGGAADEGSEMVSVWIIGGESNIVQVLPDEERGIFWSANAYMILYSYTVRTKERSALYFWKGADVTPLNFLTWRFQLSQLLQSMPAAPAPRTINQGEEPERFIALMEGTLILTGSHPLMARRAPSQAAAQPAAPQAAAVAAADAEEAEGDDGLPVESLPSLDGVVLLQLKRYAPTPLGVCARQVPARVYYLDSRDAFLMLHGANATLLLWTGTLAPKPLGVAARAIAQRILDAQPHLRFTCVAEGAEPDAFWQPMAVALTNMQADASRHAAAPHPTAFDAMAAQPTADVTGGSPSHMPSAERLAIAEAQLPGEIAQARSWRTASGVQRTFMWRVRALGRGASRVAMERSRAGIPLRSALCSDAVLVVDAVVCLFVWVGEEATEGDETLAMQIAQAYAQSAGRAVQVSHVLAGAEPDEFRRIFHGWIPWSTSPDPHGRRRDKLCRRMGLTGRVMRDIAWPGNPATDFGIAAEAAEEVRTWEAPCRQIQILPDPGCPESSPATPDSSLLPYSSPCLCARPDAATRPHTHRAARWRASMLTRPLPPHPTPPGACRRLGRLLFLVWRTARDAHPMHPRAPPAQAARRLVSRGRPRHRAGGAADTSPPSRLEQRAR